MELLARLADWSLLAFALLLFIAQCVAFFIGYRAGGKKSIERADIEGVNLIVSGILALFAFVLALTLSYANTRFIERRHAALEEANAIGTAWLRAEAIGNPHGDDIAKLLENYIGERRSFLQAPRKSPELDAINKRTAALQSDIWGHVTDLSRQRSDAVVAALMASLNESFDDSSAQRFAYEASFPPQMFWLLTLLALVAVGSLGYQLGLKGCKTLPIVSVLIAVWTVVIVMILDISAPRIGSLRTGTAVYDWTLSGFQTR